MRVMIVDDEQPSLSELVYLLHSYADADIAGAFLSPFDALAVAGSLAPDVLFLDCVMPRMSGAELGQKILALCPAVRLVFVTAYARELSHIRGMPVFAALLKPVNTARLDQLMSRLRASPTDTMINGRTKAIF